MHRASLETHHSLANRLIKMLCEEGSTGSYFCFDNRCVRRAFLCGFDPVTGQSYEHRKEWIELRPELLAVSFGIEICDFALLAAFGSADIENAKSGRLHSTRRRLMSTRRSMRERHEQPTTAFDS